MINSPDANSHLCILLARKQPQGYACVRRISQSPPNSLVWYEVNNIHFGFLVVALDQE